MSRPLSSDVMSAARVAAAETQDAGTLAPPCPEGLSVEVANTAADLEKNLEHWRELAHGSIEPAVYGTPEWLLPMLRHVGKGDSSTGALLVGDSPASGHLLGVVPFRLETHKYGLPVRILDSWTGDLFFFGVPLIAGINSQDVLLEVLQGAGGLLGAKAVLVQMVPTDGPFAKALRTVAGDAGLPVADIEPFERAGLVCDRDFDTWFNASFTRKRRKEYRRLRARLGEFGILEFSRYGAGEPLQPWIDDFLRLEQAGWKGQGGTAIGCHEGASAFLADTMAAFERSDRLMIWKLSVDGAPVAMLIAVVCGRKAWLIKIAHDESYARYSPGVLLILDATRELLGQREVDVVDSSAVPDHPMINHVWRDRLAMTNIMVATPGTSRTAFNLLVSAETGKRRARAVAKSVYHRYVKRGSK